MKYIKTIFLVICFYFYLAAIATAQFQKVDKFEDHLPLVNLSVSDGLYENNINDVYQDYLGFLWLAGDFGLQKYDGYIFTLYIPDSTNLLSQAALGLYEDKNNNLWIRMQEGLIRYRRELDDFVKYSLVDSMRNSLEYKVSAMTEDLNGTLWVWIEDKGLYTIDTENNIFVPHSKVNKWFRAIKNPVILKEGNEKGIYETWVKFSSEYYGSDLLYRFALQRLNGTSEWEQNFSPDDPEGWGNRVLNLSGDSLILPAVSFNSNTKNDRKSIKIIKKLKSGSTYVKFRINLNTLENPLSIGDEIQIKGNSLPLKWDEKLSANCLIFDLENNLWIGLGSSGLFQFDLETGDFKTFFKNSVISKGLSNNTINTALRDMDGNLWFGSNRGLNKYSPDNNSFKSYFIDPANRSNVLNHIFRMADDGQGNIWTISQEVKGLGCFNKSKKEYLHYSKGLDAWISSVTIDRSGIVWLGNWYQGIYKFDPNAKKFSSFSIKKNKDDILNGKRILAVYEDRTGEIWIGGELGGLYRYDRKTEKTSFYEIKGGNFEAWIENYIWDIFQDSKGNFWIGTQGGLCSFNPKTGSFKHIQQPHDIDLGLGTTAKIHEDANGNLWLVTRNGLLVQFKPDTYETEVYPLNYPLNYPEGSPNRSYPDLIEDPRGFLWIGWAFDQGNGGLLKFDLKKKKLSFLKQLENLNITSLCIDNGILWCATRGSGLIRYDTENSTKTLINTTHGLLSNSIMGLEKDNAGNLWISSPRGLSKYNPQEGVFNHYFKEDGFLSNNFTYSAHSKCDNGKMIFGSLHGVVTFYPDSIKDRYYKAPLTLTEFKIDNKPLKPGNNSPLKEHISVSDEILLNYDQNDLSISFASMDFSHPQRNDYTFYLQNLEEDWRPAARERTAYYTNLDPGTYIFKVKGTNSDGVWNKAETSLKIIIMPPWWRTWWAYMAYGLLFLATLYSLRHYELNRQKLKNNWQLKQMEAEKYQEIDQMKSRFFANISHEFRTPLTLIKGPVQQMLSGEFIGNVKQQYGMILRNTDRLLLLINQLLDLSRLDSGQMTLRAAEQDIIPLLRGLTYSFESLARLKNIELEFRSTEEQIKIYIDRDKFEKIIVNLLSNAFKFTQEGGAVGVEVKHTNEFSADDGDNIIPALEQDDKVGFIFIGITNTGPVIPFSQIDKIFDRFYQADDSLQRGREGSGIGLALVKELTELHYGTISVDSQPEKGTTFTILLPLGKRHLLPQEMISDSIETDYDRDTGLLAEQTKLNDDVSEKTIPAVGDFSRLLIVEDNADMRAYMLSCLEDKYKINHAGDGQKGLELAIKQNPDIIISDVMMPGMDGFQFCAKIKSDHRTSHIPVILLTAKASSESKIEGLESGADDYLTKPFDKIELQVRLNNLIQQRRKLQEKFRSDLTIRPADITITSVDEKLLQRAIKAVEIHIADSAFDTTAFAREVGVSRMLLNTKIKAITGQTSGEFIRTLRLKRAAKLLQQNAGNVGEVAFEVGFQNLSYFTKIFREQFGVTPSKFFID